MLHSVDTKKDSLFGEYETMSFLEPSEKQQKSKKKIKQKDANKMIICTWYDKSKILMQLSKVDGQYYLDGSPIDNKMGCKLDNYNYKKALEVLKNEC